MNSEDVNTVQVSICSSKDSGCGLDSEESAVLMFVTMEHHLCNDMDYLLDLLHKGICQVFTYTGNTKMGQLVVGFNLFMIW